MKWLALLFVLACPLMHLFMHREHGHAAHETAEVPDGTEPEQR